MLQPFLLTLSLLPWIPAFLCGITYEEELSVMEGQNLTIPCHYEPQYASYVKYWSRGKTREFCTSLARTDESPSANPSEKKVRLFDDPVQQVFTVTMSNLKEQDSGWYMCGVEIGSIWRADVVTYKNIKVIHGMTVENSRLSGEEGSSVTVECQYSERYRDSEKKWCRSGDWSSCLSAGSEGSYEDSSVDIKDDRSGSFTITLKKLQMRHTGWYWCSAGLQKMPVLVQVKPRPMTTLSVTSPPQTVVNPFPHKPITKESWSGYRHILGSLLVCVFFILVGLAILARKWWKRHKQGPVRRQLKEMDARRNEYSDVGDLQNATAIFLNKDSQDVIMY
ncbi:polymeric immunoglobulin receptor isoform X2 [Eleginops maclovinus]